MRLNLLLINNQNKAMKLGVMKYKTLIEQSLNIREFIRLKTMIHLTSLLLLALITSTNSALAKISKERWSDIGGLSSVLSYDSKASLGVACMPGETREKELKIMIMAEKGAFQSLSGMFPPLFSIEFGRLSSKITGFGLDEPSSLDRLSLKVSQDKRGELYTKFSGATSFRVKLTNLVSGQALEYQFSARGSRDAMNRAKSLCGV